MLLLFCVKESMRCAADSKGLLQMCDGVFVDTVRRNCPERFWRLLLILGTNLRNSQYAGITLALVHSRMLCDKSYFCMWMLCACLYVALHFGSKWNDSRGVSLSPGQKVNAFRFWE
jgi:hypothetical protein